LIDDMRAGWIDSLIVQNPFKMGYESVRAIGMKLAGQAPPDETDSGATLVRAGDLEKPEIRELLFPDIHRYLQLSSTR
jgi:ribose transport system substrate-binding protein